MKAMLLAAGLGKRLRPMTDSLPKPLLPVAGRTLIDLQISRLKAAGITDFVINVHHLGHVIEERLGDGSAHGVSISYSREAVLLETGGGIRKALDLLGDEPFAVISADAYIEFDFNRLPRVLSPGSLGCLVMVDNPGHHPDGDFSLEDGWLGHGSDTRTYTGVGVLTPEFIGLGTGEAFKLREVFDLTISEGRLEGILHDGYWCDVGTAERYKELQKHLLSQGGDQ